MSKCKEDVIAEGATIKPEPGHVVVVHSFLDLFASLKIMPIPKCFQITPDSWLAVSTGLFVELQEVGKSKNTIFIIIVAIEGLGNSRVVDVALILSGTFYEPHQVLLAHLPVSAESLKDLGEDLACPWSIVSRLVEEFCEWHSLPLHFLSD